MDDCATYELAAAEGVPVTTGRMPVGHKADYEQSFGMNPERLEHAFFRELVVFDDVGQNRGKRCRCRSLSEKLLAHVDVRPHPGVFVIRGLAGERRLLKNEWEVAERLRDRRGLRIIDPLKESVHAIVAACAGAAMVVGVEGSALMHGILALPEGGSLLTLQPPNRFVGLYKHLTDRDNQRFGFVVGQPVSEDFSIDPIEVERTMDLLCR
jgi:hypothetical protein